MLVGAQDPAWHIWQGTDSMAEGSWKSPVPAPLLCTRPRQEYCKDTGLPPLADGRNSFSLVTLEIALSLTKKLSFYIYPNPLGWGFAVLKVEERSY